MTEKLYGLDDIPEGWRIAKLCYEEDIDALEGEPKRYVYECHMDCLDGRARDFLSMALTPQLALHRAIQKARGEA
ncbi:MAG: hypothetical protein M3O22_05000 [Pseudomonadota bacterium]|nr:hypothetical protein [Pseudomonadota bacterium]